MRELVAEEFRQSLHFELMYQIKVEPLCATWDDKGFSLVLFLYLSDLWNFSIPVHLFLSLIFGLRLIILYHLFGRRLRLGYLGSLEYKLRISNHRLFFRCGNTVGILHATSSHLLLLLGSSRSLWISLNIVVVLSPMVLISIPVKLKCHHKLTFCFFG